jgi:hypothetical protein
VPFCRRNKPQSTLDDHALPQLWSGLPRIVFWFVRIVFGLFVLSARQTTINSCKGNCQGLRCRSFRRRNKQQSAILDDHALPQLWSGLSGIVCFLVSTSSILLARDNLLSLLIALCHNCGVGHHGLFVFSFEPGADLRSFIFCNDGCRR